MMKFNKIVGLRCSTHDRLFQICLPVQVPLDMTLVTIPNRVDELVVQYFDGFLMLR